MNNSQYVKIKVDGKLPKADWMHQLLPGHELIPLLLEDTKHLNHEYLYSSFDATELAYHGADSFFQCVLLAYRFHKSLVFSPDMIWLKILQEFSRHINNNPEKYRSRFVGHADRKELTVVMPNGEFDKEHFSVDLATKAFKRMLSRDTVGNTVSDLSCDFTTTTAIDKIVSQITLMDLLKPYYKYRIHRMICGIPYITLTGKLDDWKRIIEKTKKLYGYDLDFWIDDLTNILQEFVNAIEGNANRTFWRSIVTKRRPKELSMGGGCIPPNNPYIDGWILKFYPFNRDGHRFDKHDPNIHMASEVVSVPFTYTETAPIYEKSYSMELWGGFVGATIDDATDSLTPHIGWFIRQSETDDSIAAELFDKNGNLDSNITFYVTDQVPSFLSKAKHIYDLTLDFGDNYVELPQWLNVIDFDYISVFGKYHRDDLTRLRKEFPRISFYNN